MNNFSGTDATFFNNAPSLWGMYFGGGGSWPMSGEIYIAPEPWSGGYGAHWGIYINGAKAIEDADILLGNTGATNGVYSTGQFGTSFITDASTAQYGIRLDGSYSSGIALQIKGHLGITGAVPLVDNCGAGPTIVGTDTAGTITVGSGTVTACHIWFNKAYDVPPSPVAMTNVNGAVLYAYLVDGSEVTFGSNINIGLGKIYYHILPND